MSVDLEALIVERGLDPRTYVTTPRFMGSVYFSAGLLRADGFLVGFDPLPDDPCHGEVWGSFTRSARSRLRNSAVWFVPIGGVRLV